MNTDALKSIIEDAHKLAKVDIAPDMVKPAVETIALRLERLVKDGLYVTPEAAHKRERGDCAKLREALKLCMDEMCSRCRELAAARSNPLPCLQGCEPVRKAKAALAAPPRNCDRFDSSTQARAEWYKTEVLPRVEGVVSGVEPPFVDWLFAPATEKEGGAK